MERGLWFDFVEGQPRAGGAGWRGVVMAWGSGVGQWRGAVAWGSGHSKENASSIALGVREG